MNNKKGFTVMELLTVIIILGVLLLIAVPSISRLMKKFRLDYYDKLEDSITEIGASYFNDNPINKPRGLLLSEKVSLYNLINNGYVSYDEIVDYKGKSCADIENDQSYVLSLYEGPDNGYSYHTCLYCPSDNYKTDSAYCGTIDDVPSYYSNSVYVYYDTTREILENKLYENGIIVSRTLDGTNSLNATINILPINIDSIDTKVQLDSNNSKVYILDYRYSGEETNNNDINVSGFLTIYRHFAPSVMVTNQNDELYGYDNVIYTEATIRLSRPSNDLWYFKEETRTDVSKYQYYDYSTNEWKDVLCDVNSCYIKENKVGTHKYKFRILTKNNYISEESSEYTITIIEDNTKTICEYSAYELFGTKKSTDNFKKTERFGPSNNPWECRVEGYVCKVNYGYDRVCSNNDNCGTYYGKTSNEINRLAGCSFATYWCTCDDSDASIRGFFEPADLEEALNNFKVYDRRNR